MVKTCRFHTFYGIIESTYNYTLYRIIESIFLGRTEERDGLSDVCSVSSDEGSDTQVFSIN